VTSTEQPQAWHWLLADGFRMANGQKQHVADYADEHDR
jgi:hypothetical protein